MDFKQFSRTTTSVNKSSAMQWKSASKQCSLTKPLSAKTLLHHFRLLQSMFEKAVKWNIVYNNPCDRVDPSKLKRKEAWGI